MRLSLLISTFFFFFSPPAHITRDANFVETILNEDPRISYSLDWKPIPRLNGTGGTLTHNDKASGTASLRLYTQYWYILPAGTTITKSGLGATRIVVLTEYPDLITSDDDVDTLVEDCEQHDVALYWLPAWTSDILYPSAYYDLQVIKQNPAGQNTSLDPILLIQSFWSFAGQNDCIFETQSSGSLTGQSTSLNSILVTQSGQFLTPCGHPTASSGTSIGLIPVLQTEATYSDSLVTTTEQTIAILDPTLVVPDPSTSFARSTKRDHSTKRKHSTKRGHSTKHGHSTKRETPTKQPDGQSGLPHSTKVGIAGALVGGVCLGLFGALGIYLLRKRLLQKRTEHDGTLHPFREVVQPLFQSNGAPYAGTGGVSPLVGAGGVNTRPNRARKGRGPNNPGTVPARRTSVNEDTAAFPLAPPQPPQPPPGPLLNRSSAPPAYSP